MMAIVFAVAQTNFSTVVTAASYGYEESYYDSDEPGSEEVSNEENSTINEVENSGEADSNDGDDDANKADSNDGDDDANEADSNDGAEDANEADSNDGDDANEADSNDGAEDANEADSNDGDDANEANSNDGDDDANEADSNDDLDNANDTDLDYNEILNNVPDFEFPIQIQPFAALSTPIVTLNANGHTLTWDGIVNARLISFYVNGVFHSRLNFLSGAQRDLRTLTGLTAGGTYQIQIRRHLENDPSTYSELSDVVTFTLVPQSLPSPVITLDPNGRTLRWEAVANADGFRLYIDGGFRQAFNANARNTDLLALSGLTNGDTYQVQLTATSTVAAWDSSDFSNTVNFTRDVPQLPTPVITLDPNGHILRWSSISGAWQLRIYVDGTFNRTVTASTLSFDLRDLSGLTDGGTYQIHAMAIPTTASNVWLGSELSNTINFTMVRPQLQTPVITLDPDGVMLRWDAVPSVSQFRLYIDGVANRTFAQNIRSFDLGTLASLIDGATYQIELRAVAFANTFWLDSELSNEITFNKTSDVTLLQAPAITLDADGHTIRWNAVNNAGGFRLYVDGAFNRTFTGATRNHDLHSIAGLTIGGSYQIQLRAVPSSSAFSDSALSNAIGFTLTTLQLQAPVITLDADGFILRWDEVPSATSFSLYIDGVFNRAFTGATRNHDLRSIAAITNGSTYEIQLKATSTSNLWADSELSNAVSFTIPQLQAPAITLDTNGHTLRWDAVPNANEFRLYVDGVFNRTFAANTRNHDLRNLSTLIDGGTYQIQLRATSTNNSWVDSELSNAITFALELPQLQAPIITLDANGHTLRWDAVPNVSVFRLYVDGVFNRSFNSLTRIHDLRTLAEHIPDTARQIQLRATGAKSSFWLDSEFSNSISFTMSSQALQAPYPSRAYGRNTMTWSWGRQSDTAEFRLYINGMHRITLAPDVRSFDLTTLEGLTENGNYRLQLRAISSNDLFTDSALGGSIHFRRSEMLPTPVLILGEDGRHIRWTNARRGSWMRVYVNGVYGGIQHVAVPVTVGTPLGLDYVSSPRDIFPTLNSRFNFSPGGTYQIQLRASPGANREPEDLFATWVDSEFSNSVTFYNRAVWQLETPQIRMSTGAFTGLQYLVWASVAISEADRVRIPAADEMHLYVNGVFNRILPAHFLSHRASDWGLVAGDVVQLRSVSTNNDNEWVSSELSNSIVIGNDVAGTLPLPPVNDSDDSGSDHDLDFDFDLDFWTPTLPPLQPLSDLIIAQNDNDVYEQIQRGETGITLTLENNAETISISNRILGLMTYHELELTLLTNRDTTVTLSSALMQEMLEYSEFVYNADVFELTIRDMDYTQINAGDNIVLAALTFSINVNGESIADFEAPFIVTSYIAPSVEAYLNTNYLKITAINAFNVNVGGNYNSNTGMFTFLTNNTGDFTIAYVYGLQRLVLSLDSGAIVDLVRPDAHFAPMNVLPVVQDDQILVPIHAFADVLGEEISQNLMDQLIQYELPVNIDDVAKMPLNLVSELFDVLVKHESQENIIIVR